MRQALEIRIPSGSWVWSGWQRALWLSPAKNKLINAGRGAGKDIACIRCGLRDAFEIYGRKSEARRAGERHLVMNPVVRGILAGPTEENVKQLRADFQGELERLVDDVNHDRGPEDQVHYEQLFRYVAREDKFVVYDRGEIEFDVIQTSTRGCFRGSGVDILIYTEFAFGRREAYTDELPGTLQRAGRAGIQYLNSTPYWTADSPDAPSGGLWSEFCQEASGGQPEPADIEATLSRLKRGRDVAPTWFQHGHPATPEIWEYFYASSFDNEFLTPEQRTEIRAEAKKEATFQRERLARFTMPEGKGCPALERELILSCLVDRRPADDPGQVSIGLDLARFGDDETCFVAVGEESYLVLWVEFQPMSTGPEIVSGMERMSTRFPGCKFQMDTQAHQAFVRDFCPRHLNIMEHKIRDNERYVLGMKALMEIGRILIPNPDSDYPFSSEGQREGMRKLVGQLIQYQKVEKAGEKIKYTHPGNGHDDAVTALYQAVDPVARAQRGRVDVDRTRRRISKLLV